MDAHVQARGLAQAAVERVRRAIARRLSVWGQTLGDTEEAFIQAEVNQRLNSYRTSGQWWRVAQLGLWALVTLLGLLIAVVAGLKHGHGTGSSPGQRLRPSPR